MRINLSPCQRFRHLLHDREDRVLTTNEDAFLDQHRSTCESCRTAERSNTRALNMLRSATIEPEPALHFEERVIRKLRVQTVRESLGYWSPALAGAGLACLAIFAALTLMGRPHQIKRADMPTSEARLFDPHRVYPDLELQESNRFVR